MPDELELRLHRLEDRLNLVEQALEAWAMEEEKIGTSAEIAVPPEESLHNGVPWWLPEYRHGKDELGGIVVDEGVARNTPCLRYDLGNSSELVFSKGVVGALDDLQKALYCPSTVTKETPPELREHLNQAREGIETCKAQIAGLPEGEKITAWIKCIEREWRRRGIKSQKEQQ